MTDCWGCQSYERGEVHSYMAGCIECQARSIAQSPAFVESKSTGRLLPAYKAALEHVFDGDWQRGHELVKGWADRLGCSEQR